MFNELKVQMFEELEIFFIIFFVLMFNELKFQMFEEL